MKKYTVAVFIALALPLMAGAEEVKVDSSTNTSVKVQTTQRKTPEEIEAYKAQLRAQKTPEQIEAYKAELRAQKEEMRNQMDQKREVQKTEAEQKRQEALQTKTQVRAEFRADLAKTKVSNVVRMMNATIEHLEGIIQRIESRIEKLNDRGGDTSESEGFVASAKVDLGEASASVDAFASLDLSGDSAETNFERIRTLAAEAREHLRDARDNLIKAVRSLSSVEIEIEASTETEIE